MKVKDIAEKYLLSYNDVFADIVNGAVFGGEEIVKSNELADANLITQFKDDQNIHHEQVRDIAKFWKKNEVIFSFIGIENQSAPDKDMILRIISYDGATYKSQMGNESIYPVLTIVIYWGKYEWKAPVSLQERINCPRELADVIPDYRFKLIDIGRLSGKELIKFKSDFRLVAEFIARQKEYKPGKEEIKHPEELLDLLDLLAGDKRFKELKGKVKNIRKEGRIINMCELLDEIENRGIEKGIEQGIEKGIEKGRSEGEETATLRIAKKFKDSNVSIDIIMKATGLAKEEIEEL